MMSRSLNKTSLDKLEAFQHKLIADESIAQSHVAIYRDGKYQYNRFNGIQRGDNKPIKQDSIYRYYSMSKPIVSLALMQLFEQGKFLLSDPVHLYLGKTWKKKNMSIYKSGNFKDGYKTTKCKSTVTIKHLLTHTSGLSYGFDPHGIVNKVDEILYKEGYLPHNDELSVVEWAKKLPKAPLSFTPGTAYQYGFNSDVVGALVEIISGQPLDIYLQEKIFAPLGMVDTAFWVDPTKYHRFVSQWMASNGVASMADVGVSGNKKKNTATNNTGSKLKELDFMWSDNQETRNKTAKYVDPKHMKPVFNSGGGGLCGTMQDYCRFCEMLLHGGRSPVTGNRIISSHTIAFMTSNHLTKNGKETDFGGMSIPGYTEATATDGVGFGLGFSVVGNRALSKQIESVGTYSWGGAASTSFIIDPKENMFVIHMTALRFRDDRKLPLKMKLLQHVYGSIDDDVNGVYMSKL